MGASRYPRRTKLPSNRPSQSLTGPSTPEQPFEQPLGVCHPAANQAFHVNIIMSFTESTVLNMATANAGMGTFPALQQRGPSQSFTIPSQPIPFPQASVWQPTSVYARVEEYPSPTIVVNTSIAPETSSTLPQTHASTSRMIHQSLPPPLQPRPRAQHRQRHQASAQDIPAGEAATRHSRAPRTSRDTTSRGSTPSRSISSTSSAAAGTRLPARTTTAATSTRPPACSASSISAACARILLTTLTGWPISTTSTAVRPGAGSRGARRE
uniref:Uncharacterized protein n=1 Tax=Bionectria ochroleuca TaxID=29856 RepID=A0A8H7NLT7_BIOOC